MKIKYTLIIFIMIFCSKLSYADTATASQSIRIIIPKLALIDVNNTSTPLEISFDPIVDAGDNFKKATATSYYDITYKQPSYLCTRLFARITLYARMSFLTTDTFA